MAITLEKFTSAVLHTVTRDINIVEIDGRGYWDKNDLINLMNANWQNNIINFECAELIMINNGLNVVDAKLEFSGTDINNTSWYIKTERAFQIDSVYLGLNMPYTRLWFNTTAYGELFIGASGSEFAGFTYFLVYRDTQHDECSFFCFRCVETSIIPGESPTLRPASVMTQTFHLPMTDNTMISYDTHVVPTPSDPYNNAGDSDTGGGGGSWDNSSDPVPIPSLPSVGATNTGFITLFVPSQSQLKQVAEYLWGGLFDISTYLRLFEDPMDCILGLSVVPVSVPTSGSATITVGNIELSGISLPVASQQYVEVDCGSLTVDPYFGSYLDYEPYTKMSLFVPYSGVHTVNADDIMGRTVNLVYHIDILTGSLVAFLKCGDSVLYEFNGACGSNIPVNSMNYASTIENAIRIAVNIGTTVATAGASAPATAGAETVKNAQNVARGISLAGSTADGALSLKPNIDRAGSLGGTTGLLGNQIPYFIVTRPRLCKPKDQNKIKGYPAFINYAVSDLVGKGYTEFDTILLQNLYLTDDEKNELESILGGGVYL